MRILLVISRYYDAIAEQLELGAITACQDAGAEYEIIEVPGALEIPAAVALAIKSKRYDAYVALGCVVRGETSHYDTVCNESARGLMQLSLDHNAAIGNAILTTENKTQAMTRANVTEGNKGAGAVEAALSLHALKQKWQNNA